MRYFLGFALACSIVVSMAGRTAMAEQRPIGLIAEAEDFRVERGPWEIVPYRENYYASTFALTFLSRMACLGAPEQMDSGEEAVASQAVRVPYAGESEVLTRYEQPFDFSAEFTVQIEQNSRAVYRQPLICSADPRPEEPHSGAC